MGLEHLKIITGLANTKKSAICSKIMLRNGKICLNSKTNLEDKNTGIVPEHSLL